jgi:hypothetical protein
MKETKRILSITVKRIDDTDTNTDTSDIGEYSNTPAGEFSIARNIPGQYHYFNPGSVEAFDPAASWIPADREHADKESFWRETMRENARKDYARMESLDNGDWSFIGIRAQAEIVIGGVCQTITSGGLWGIESDSDESYFREVEREELNQLRGILHEMGFSRRAIAAALKTSK